MKPADEWFMAPLLEDMAESVGNEIDAKGIPSGRPNVAIFARQNGPTWELFFTPEAASLFPGLVRRYNAASCAAPSLGRAEYGNKLRLIRGDSSAWSLVSHLEGDE